MLNTLQAHAAHLSYAGGCAKAFQAENHLEICALTYLEAVILGIVQGVFMFVPVSSTAHLVLAQHLMIANGSQMPAPDSAAMILFDLVVHVGTLISIAIVFRKSLTQLVFAGTREVFLVARHPKWPPFIGPYLRLLLLGALTVFVTGVLGLIFKRYFELVFGAPELITFTLLITAVLLYLTDRLGKRPLGVKKINAPIAVVIGVAQALALIPGISRSGITIIAGLFMGLKRRWAAEYSFLVAIPTILAASLVQSIGVFRSAEGIDGIGAGPMLVAFIVSAIVGTFALKMVLALLYRAQLKVFSIYLIFMAILSGLGVWQF